MELKAQGKIEYINEIEQPTETLSKRTFGLDMSIEYKGRKIADYMAIDALKEKCQELDNYKVGQEVFVNVEVGNYQINADSKKGGRPIIYNNIKLISIRAAGEQAAPAPAAEATTSTAAPF